MLAGMTPLGRALALTLAVSLVLAGCAGPPYLPLREGPVTPRTPLVERGTGSFVGSGGVRLYEQWWRPRGEVKGALVLVHGLMDHGSRYGDLAERLALRGVAVYAMDLRGHGHSEGIRVGVGSFEDYLRDLDVLFAQVRAREAGKPVFLLGHSMGGAIATLYTISRKPELRGLVLSGAALAIDAPAARVLATRLVAALAPNAGVFELDASQFSRDPAVVQAMRDDPLVYTKGAPARTARELIDAVHTLQARMGDIQTPLLVLHGASDHVTPPDGSRALYDRAQSTDRRLTLYPGAFHDLLHEPEHETVERDIVDWVVERTAKPDPAPAVAQPGTSPR